MIHWRGLISVRRGILFIMTMVSFLALFTLSIFWIYTEITDNNKTRKHIKRFVLSSQKKNIKAEANRAVDIIKALIDSKPDITEKELQNQALHILEKIRFGYGGYVFVNNYDGFALINDGKLSTRTINIKSIYDALGNNLFELEMSAAKKPEGDFIRYYYNKIGEKTQEPKVSYIIGFDRWRWIIGAGDYVADANKELAGVSLRLKKKLQLKILLIVLIFGITLITIVVVSRFVSKQVAKQLEILLYHVKNGGNQPVDTGKFWLKEIASIYREIITIEEQKREAKEELKKLNETLEKQVEQRTNDLLEKNKKLERYNRLYADREFRIKELKEELKKLRAELEECRKWIRN